MEKRSKQRLESLVRVVAFAEAHPAEGPLNYGGAREQLDEAVKQLREYAGAQVSGRQLSQAELRRQEQLITRLRVEHMRPIVTIARAQIEPDLDVRMPAALRMPPHGIRATRTLQASDAMLEAAKPFEQTFVDHGLPVDFLARFRAVRDELEGTLGGRAVLVGTHVGARKGIEVQLRRARRAVERMDAVVKAAFAHDETVLAKWRVARRIHLLPSGTGVVGKVAA